MADEFVCPECAFTSDKEEVCPFCNAKLIKFEDDMDDFAFSDDADSEESGFGTEELSNA